MTTTEINNIHNLKHFNTINQLLNIENLEVFATKINELLEQVETMQNAINDYEQERQYLMDMIAEMKGYDKNIYVFEKEEEYNTFSIPAQQEEKEEQEQEQEEQQEQHQQEEKHIKTEEEILKENKYYSVHSESEEQKEIDKKLEEQPSPIPELFSNLKDYIHSFSKYDKEHKKAIKKAIVEDFKKAGFKVKANNGHYYGLNVIIEVNKKDILDNQDLNYLSEKARENSKYYTFEYFYNRLNQNIGLFDNENIETLRNIFNVDTRKEIVFNSYDVKSYKEHKKCVVEFFYKKEVIENILETAQKILNKYAFVKYYDPYADYCTIEYTINYDFIIKLKD